MNKKSKGDQLWSRSYANRQKNKCVSGKVQKEKSSRGKVGEKNTGTQRFRCYYNQGSPLDVARRRTPDRKGVITYGSSAREGGGSCWEAEGKREREGDSNDLSGPLRPTRRNYTFVSFRRQSGCQIFLINSPSPPPPPPLPHRLPLPPAAPRLRRTRPFFSSASSFHYFLGGI